MLEFKQQAGTETRLVSEDTDKPLPSVINPKTRYAFFSTIATGGKSLIQSCKDLHLNRTICYKSLKPEFVNDEIEKQRLLREARISALLQHPNTVPTYEIGRDNRGNYYFTMKLVHGYTLREVLNYRERYDLSQLVEVLVQVGMAVAYANSRGVLHRDIKPENILIGPYGEVLLLDWGMAKVWSKDHKKDELDDNDELTEELTELVNGMTGEGKLQGTVMYMSPEQVDRDPNISFASDLYSLGAVLYEILTGKTPFQGEVIQSILEQIRNDVPPEPQSICSMDIPKPLAKLAMQCLQKQPEKRPRSASEFVRVLREEWHL